MKHTDLAPLAKGWHWRKFGDCTRLINGRAYSQEELLDSGTPVLRIQNLNGGDRWYYSNLKLPEEKYCTSGDLLYAWSATFGPYRYTGPKSIFHYHIWRVLPGDELDKDFTFRLLEWITARIKAAAHGVAMLHMTKAGMEAWLIPVPPLPEQRRIAQILDKADALRGKRRAALAQLDTLTQSIFLDMFGDPATNPKGWQRESLGNITLKVTDGEHLNPSFSKTGMPIVMAGDVLEDRIDFGTSKFVERDLGYRFRRKCDPERDDVLIVSRGATIGRLCVVRTAQVFCLMGSVILVKPFRDKIDPIFLSVFLKHPVSRHALYKTSGSSAQQAIYLKDVKKLACIVPPISLQRGFSCHVVSIEKVKPIHRASLVELDALFGALQHRAFQGEL